MILVDSSVWIDYFRGVAGAATDRLDALLGAEPVLIGDLILAEVLQGFRADAKFEMARRLLETLECVTLGGRDIGLQAAHNFRVLRRKGITERKTIDTIIATCCIARIGRTTSTTIRSCRIASLMSCSMSSRSSRLPSTWR